MKRVAHKINMLSYLDMQLKPDNSSVGTMNETNASKEELTEICQPAAVTKDNDLMQTWHTNALNAERNMSMSPPHTATQPHLKRRLIKISKKHIFWPPEKNLIGE